MIVKVALWIGWFVIFFFVQAFVLVPWLGWPELIIGGGVGLFWGRGLARIMLRRRRERLELELAESMRTTRIYVEGIVRRDVQ